MSVYKQTYQPYQGTTTPGWSRFLILPRYAYEQVSRSKFLILLMLVCCAFPLSCLVTIYLTHNLTVLKALGINKLEFLNIGETFFHYYIVVQSGWAFLMTVYLGPGLVSPDLANRALPLYLARPLSRTEYVLGKFSTLAIPLSLITWVPGLLLFIEQAFLDEASWFITHWRIGLAVVLGFWLYIAVIGLMSLAISSWVKWRMVAGAILIGAPLVISGIGAAINGIFEVQWGHLLSLNQLFETVWDALLNLPGNASVSLVDAGGGLLMVSALCLYMLSRKIKACEVVA
jgi:ABC-2 type transport system permease protein